MSATEPFGNDVGMKIWTCYDNLKAQSWDYTNNNQIALDNRGTCNLVMVVPAEQFELGSILFGSSWRFFDKL